jgi:hypothetical protein
MMRLYPTVFQGNPTHLMIEMIAKQVRDNPESVNRAHHIALAEAYLDLLSDYEDAMSVLDRIGVESSHGDEVTQ